MWIMIAGPYSIIGVNLALPVIEVAGEAMFDELMMPLSLALADRCDAVLRVGGPSANADLEVERIRAGGGGVYTSVAELPAPGDKAQRQQP